MPTNTPPTGQILFTRQRHEAKKAGKHWDYRLVHGDKAYSWATFKEMPESGKSIILFEQPVHDREYALSPVVEIPDGEYGAGITHLEFVRKANVVSEDDGKKLVLNVVTPGQEAKFLLKKLDDGKYGDKSWLFRNLTGIEKKAMTNKYLEKIASFNDENIGSGYYQQHLDKVAKIAIKPSHRGELHEDLGIPKGKKIPASTLKSEESKAKASGNKAEMKRLVFAENARKWNHK